jgi:anti-sigma factor RsiW
MSHPNHEELSEFLYDELSPARQAEVAAHVESCDARRATIESWRAVRTNLATWKLPAAPARARVASGRSMTMAPLRWAVAAALLLATGYGVARATAPKPPDLAVLRADLVRDVRQEVRAELNSKLTTHTAALTSSQREFQTRMIEALGRLETRQVVDQASMRKDVETLALHTQAEFNRWLTLMADATGGGGGGNGDVLVTPTAQ